MKKIILLSIALFVFNFANAQNKVIKVNPLGMAFGIFNGTYEQALNEKSSFTIGASYFNWSGVNISGLGGEVAYRFYFSKNNDAPEGIYAAPFFGVNSLTYDDSTNDAETALLLSLGAQAGYQWIFENGLALDLYFGYGRYISGELANSGLTLGRPKLGLAVGYNF